MCHVSCVMCHVLPDLQKEQNLGALRQCFKGIFRPNLDVFMDFYRLPNWYKKESWHKTECCSVACGQDHEYWILILFVSCLLYSFSGRGHKLARGSLRDFFYLAPHVNRRTRRRGSTASNLSLIYWFSLNFFKKTLWISRVIRKKLHHTLSYKNILLKFKINFGSIVN